MNAVKIKAIGKEFTVSTKYGDKQKRTYTVEDSLSNTFEVSKFISKDDPEVAIGETVLMELETQGKYINCRKIEKFTPITPPEPKTEEEKVDWDGKERRDFKGRCLMYAIETVKMSSVKAETMEESDIASLVKIRAIDYLEWIYTGEDTPF